MRHSSPWMNIMDLMYILSERGYSNNLENTGPTSFWIIILDSTGYTCVYISSSWAVVDNNILFLILSYSFTRNKY